MRHPSFESDQVFRIFLFLKRYSNSRKLIVYSGSQDRLKIAEALTAGRGEAHGRAERA